jgi:eukaryotic-like serine/threonine-protein kinase
MGGAPALPSELQPLEAGDPENLGPYRVVGRLGAGGMGVVFGGIDEAGHCVAVKTLHPRSALRPHVRGVFAREVELLARVDGVCVPQVRAADPVAPTPWMATDFVPGRTLRRHVLELGPLRGEMLHAFAAGTAEALAAIHGCGVLHRDIKPGNVILAPDGPKIVDFGIATSTAMIEREDAASSYCTPGWVAPERYAQAPEGEPADVFGWGGLLVMAATGRSPFGTGTPEELRQRVLEEEPDLEGLPDELRDLAAQALDKDPAQRPTAAQALRRLLPEPAGDDSAVDGSAEDDTSADATPRELARRLSEVLSRTWRGIDAAGHHPAAWGALAGAGGGVAVGGAATGLAAAAPPTAVAGGGLASSGGAVGAGTAGGLDDPASAAAGTPGEDARAKWL